MNKHVFLISTVVFLSYSMASFAQFAYRCTDQNGHVTLQGSSCPEQSDQTKVPMPTFGPVGTDELRAYELTALAQLHEHYILQKTYDYENRNVLARERVRHENVVDFEKLKHKHAIEMFDKNYQHFWMNGYSIGDAPLSFAHGVSDNSIGTIAGENSPVTSGNNSPVTLGDFSPVGVVAP